MIQQFTITRSGLEEVTKTALAASGIPEGSILYAEAMLTVSMVPAVLLNDYWDEKAECGCLVGWMFETWRTDPDMRTDEDGCVGCLGDTFDEYLWEHIADHHFAEWADPYDRVVKVIE